MKFTTRSPFMKFLRNNLCGGVRGGVANGRDRAFSLLEVLVVIAILAIMTTLLVPAIEGFSGSSGRRGAVNLVMGVLDQARVAALEQGRNVHVVLVRRPFPEQDGILVLREDENGMVVDADGNPVDQLTRWMNLPKGVLFQSAIGVFHDDVPFDLPDPPQGGEVLEYARITFGPTGTILHPNGTNNNERRIHLLDGVRNGNLETPRTQGVEVISVARYTGRPQLDVSFQ